MVMNGVETAATAVQTQAPNTWNCGAGELYFVVNATFANATSVSVAAQLPATERNFLGEGSTYAPGSEYTGGDEPSEPEQPADVVELNPYDWFKSYAGGNELELGWYDQDGHQIMIDFLMNPITPGTYTLANGLSGMYTKYRGIGMTTCTVVVTDAGDGQLAFDVNFKAQIEGVFTDYHFTWVGDPTTLQQLINLQVFGPNDIGASHSGGSDFFVGGDLMGSNGFLQVLMGSDDYLLQFSCCFE